MVARAVTRPAIGTPPWTSPLGWGNQNLKVRRGEVLGVVGGSGTGKSELMRSIIGLQVPSEGHIEVLGHTVTDLWEGSQIDIRSRWGVLFQGGALFSTLTVGENVEVPLREFYPELEPELRHDSSTNALIRRYRSQRQA